MTELPARRGSRIESVGQRRRRFAVRVGVIISVLLLGASHARAACRLSLSQASLDNFVDHPQRYLDRFPEGGQSLAFAIRGFASFSRAGLKGVAAMMRTANPLQKVAIGQGLADAVNACIPRDGDVARQIADVVKKAADHDIIDAYLAAADDGTSPSAAAAAPGAGTRESTSLSFDPDQSVPLARPVAPATAASPN